MSERAARGLLGPAGAAALDEARRALARASGDEGQSLRVAGWTAADWSFRFVLAEGRRHVVVHVPHDGSPLSIREAGHGPDPLSLGGLAPE